MGLCCGFAAVDIKFRTTTVKHASTLKPAARRRFLRELCLHNAQALTAAVEAAAAQGAGAFRANSGLLPLFTHPVVGYELDDLDADGAIRAALVQAGAVAAARGVRLSFHPDQFVVLGSASEDVVRASIDELEYQAMVGGLIGAAQLTLHGGGAAGGKEAALERFRRGLDRLSPAARALVVLENDDRVYTVADLLPVCRADGVRLVYDVHHHRCLPDGLTVLEATEAAAETWGGEEPWAHISSPSGGWTSANPRIHAEAIAPRDFPAEWLRRRMTVDVEAKDKELAVRKLRAWLDRAVRGRRPPG